MLEKVLRPKMYEVPGGCRVLDNERRHSFYFVPSILAETGTRDLWDRSQCDVRKHAWDLVI